MYLRRLKEMFLRCHWDVSGEWDLFETSHAGWAETKIKISVNLTNKHKGKSKNFIILIFFFPVFFLRSLVCCQTSTISFSIPVSFLFEDSFKLSKEQITINET